MENRDTHTSSIAWPNMFDVTRNRVAIYEGSRSIVNRTKLLILSNPTELFNEPTFGVGLKRYLWQYNNANTKAVIQAKIVEQLHASEPYVDADKTVFTDGLVYSGDTLYEGTPIEDNELKMTVGLQTIYKDTLNLSIDIEAEWAKMFNGNTTED